jgi:superfamily I DNA and/or RNA helicase
VSILRNVKNCVVSAPSNAAVANLALMLFRTKQFRIHEILVWGDGCDDSVQFLNAEIRSKKYKGLCRNYASADDEDEKAKKLRDFYVWLHQDVTETTSLEDLGRLCQHNNRAPLESVRFFFCTLNTAGARPLRKAAKGRFDLLILDEAGQCPEAESYIATTFPGVRRAAFFGDPNQLPATVIDQSCREAGYGQSLLE